MQATEAPLGERALLLTLGHAMDPAINARVHALAAALAAAEIDGTTDIVPAHASVMLYHALTAPDAVARWYQQVRQVVTATADGANPDVGTLHEVPVCYDGADLGALAAAHELTPDEVIARHTAPEYRVAMIGFAPGFPYLSGLDPLLATPRHGTPRTRVPAGAVAIGGAQTGIYPSELPGGWQLLGRTSLALFDAANPDHPCLMQAGDRVRFHAVDDAQHSSSGPQTGTAPC